MPPRPSPPAAADEVEPRSGECERGVPAGEPDTDPATEPGWEARARVKVGYRRESSCAKNSLSELMSSTLHEHSRKSTRVSSSERKRRGHDQNLRSSANVLGYEGEFEAFEGQVRMEGVGLLLHAEQVVRGRQDGRGLVGREEVHQPQREHERGEHRQTARLCRQNTTRTGW